MPVVLIISYGKLTLYDPMRENNVFNVDLIDELSEIRCVAFGAMFDKLYRIFEIQKINRVTNETIQQANSNFNRLGHEFGILLTEKSKEEKVQSEISTIKPLEFEFIKLKNILDVKTNKPIDVIGTSKPLGTCKRQNQPMD
ncbi:Uncharacterized protein FWK35_00023715 [Aphis craccivora]|uniref:Uncharacterized protein n=1 Tax=Aphis craccivora TaxID=307492 RepID=A0A6G0Y1D7_APHCR|nr:Uncharacterized protein FWK35_00023715 [Aphis craccivora]